MSQGLKIFLIILAAIGSLCCGYICCVFCCWFAFYTDRQAKKARFYKYWEVVREKAQVVEGEIHQELMEIFGRDITNVILEFYETRLCHNDDPDESEFSLL